MRRIRSVAGLRMAALIALGDASRRARGARPNPARAVVLACAVLIGPLSGLLYAAAPAYRLVARWDLGPAERWDYATFDPVRRRVFIAHGDRVIVIEAGSGKKLGEIADTQGVHGIALAQDLKLGFATNGKANSVSVFDLETLAPLREIAVSGISPDALVYEPANSKTGSGAKVYTFNGRSDDVSVIDTNTWKEVAKIKTAGKPEFAVADGAGKVYVNIQSDAGQMQVIDAAADRILGTWDLPGCRMPTGLAINIGAQRLFSVCANRTMAVTDSGSGRHVASVPVGEGPDAAVVDPATGTIFSSNGQSGTLTIVSAEDAERYRVAASLVTQKGARTMAFDAATRRIYLPVVESGRMFVLVAAPQ